MEDNSSNVAILTEKITTDVEGTVIDIETTGEFDRRYRGDSREYRNHQQVIFGYLDFEKLSISCASESRGIDELKERTKIILSGLDRSFYAFNCSFESSIFFHQLGIEVNFDGELQRFKLVNKKYQRRFKNYGSNARK